MPNTLSTILRRLVARQSNAICVCVSCLLADYGKQCLHCPLPATHWLWHQPLHTKGTTYIIRRRRTSVPLCHVMIATLSTCAQLERDNISFRLQSGRKRYIEKGGKLGRKVGSVKTAEQMKTEYREVISLLRKGYSIRDMAKLCGKGVSTVQRVKRLLKVQSSQ